MREAMEKSSAQNGWLKVNRPEKNECAEEIM